MADETRPPPTRAGVWAPRELVSDRAEWGDFDSAEHLRRRVRPGERARRRMVDIGPDRTSVETHRHRIVTVAEHAHCGPTDPDAQDDRELEHHEGEEHAPRNCGEHAPSLVDTLLWKQGPRSLLSEDRVCLTPVGLRQAGPGWAPRSTPPGRSPVAASRSRTTTPDFTVARYPCARWMRRLPPAGRS